MVIADWLLFASVSLAASATPGPAVLLVTSHSLQHGWQRSLVTIAGNVTGLLLLSAMAVAGAGSVLLRSPMAFAVLKVAGALYLGYLGIKIWRNGISLIQLPDTETAASQRLSLYRSGLMLALTNPKAWAFTVALLPQFLDPLAPLLPQFLILVTTFMAGSFTCLGLYALLAARFATMNVPTRFRAGLAFAVATLFVLAAISLLLTHAPGG